MSIILSKDELARIKENKPFGKGSYANLYKYDDKLIGTLSVLTSESLDYSKRKIEEFLHV